MNPQSEIILEKIVDYFGEWEEPVVKNKTTFKEKEKNIRKEKKRKIKGVVDLDNELVRERREELLIFKKELKLLNSGQIAKKKVSRDLYTKTRQQELIHAKKILQAELSNQYFIKVS